MFTLIVRDIRVEHTFSNVDQKALPFRPQRIALLVPLAITLLYTAR